ncbi:MAG: hypothetical protein IT306_09330 [Chloroflexi bacterium]|nr:hypothetical protein [Chloroflexota bacterium]
MTFGSSSEDRAVAVSSGAGVGDGRLTTDWLGVWLAGGVGLADGDGVEQPATTTAATRRQVVDGARVIAGMLPDGGGISL